MEQAIYIFQNNEQNETNIKLQNYKRQTSQVLGISFTGTPSVIYIFFSIQCEGWDFTGMWKALA